MDEIKRRIATIEKMLVDSGIDMKDAVDIIAEVKDLMHYSVVYGRSRSKE